MIAISAHKGTQNGGCRAPLVQFATRKRSCLVGVKGLIDNNLGLIAARKLIYANQIGEDRTLQVVDEAQRAERDNQ
jgi:hypothetical protein